MDCLFCSIVDGLIPSKKVYETDDVLCFYDIAPVAPVHVLIVPKKHIDSVHQIGAEDVALVGQIHQAAQAVADQLGIADSGYRLVTNCGKDAGQEVFHLHYHLVGGGRLSHFGQTDIHTG